MRKAVVSVSGELLTRARALGIDVRRAAEEGIEEAIRVHRKPGFLRGKVDRVPDSFFDPLPHEELQRWSD